MGASYVGDFHLVYLVAKHPQIPEIPVFVVVYLPIGNVQKIQNQNSRGGDGDALYDKYGYLFILLHRVSFLNSCNRGGSAHETMSKLLCARAPRIFNMLSWLNC